MKYFTKDWYSKMQKTNMHLLLRVDQRCKKYSDELYLEFYNKEKDKYLKTMSFYEDFDEFCKLMSNVDKTFNELEEIDKKRKFLEFRDEQLEGLSLSETFDKKIDFAVNNLKEKLSEDILNDVADIRVLALGYTSSDIYTRIEEYCLTNEKFVNEKVLEYANYEKETFVDRFDFLDENLHDSFIVNCEVKNNDFYIVIENIISGNKKIIFKDYENILDDGSLNETRWLYEEVYKVDNCLEVHILVCGLDGLREMIIKCSEVVVE